MSKTPNEAVVSTLNIETKQPAAAVAANSTEIVEAGCSFSGDQIDAEPGSTNIVACPAGCEEDGVIYGTDIYTGHTYICIAAIHSGLITAQQGGR